MDPSLIAKLHPLERKVLPVLKTQQELSTIVLNSGLQEVEVLRALQWLENKGVLKINSIKKKLVILDNNGLKYKKNGLPERTFLKVLTENYQGTEVLAKKANLSNDELSACLGQLKRKAAIEITKDKELMVRLTGQGKKLQQEVTLEEKFLQKEFPLELESIKDVDKFVLEELKKRKEIVKVEERKLVTITLTELGHKLTHMEIKEDVVNRLTKEMIKTGSWKKKDFRAYDIEINVPKITAGKKHFVNEATDYAKKIWIEMGFKEMKGNYVSTSFWDFDALFVPQDHPAREMQDTYFLGGSVEKGKLPYNKELIKRVKSAHENGGNTNSKGWGYKWSEKEAQRNILRTHTTVLTAHTLAELKDKDLPAKFFAVGKCFRNEALDWKHLFEFNQTEGIVVSEEVNLRHLMGYLREFAKKMGYPKVRFRPAFFPYTSPSLEGDVYDQVRKQWVEFIAAGMLRPEVVKPLFGKDIPVLAWGPGIDRILCGYYGITDIRELYKNDLKQLREIRMWLK